MTHRARFVLSAFAATMLLAACGRSPLGPSVQTRGSLSALGKRDAGQPTVIVGAGDIAYQGPGAEATAKLLDAIPGLVFTLGDNAYADGKPEEFKNYFDPTWGRHKARIHPVIGNHEYHTPHASGYFGYFGAAAGDPTKGYYSYDIDAKWHAVAVNSNPEQVGGLGVGSPEYQWLSDDLDAHQGQNVVVMWHHPRWSTGHHGDSKEVDALWRLCSAKGVDIVLWGHDHHYERFHPMDAEGKRDDKSGLRAFLVGCGGKNHYPFYKLPHRTTAVRNAKVFGVLKLSLWADHYDFEFVPEAGAKFQDKGTAPIR
jgi:hypothetical protein